MSYVIENPYLRVEIQEKGGSLCSIQDRTGAEYLWQGDPAYWDGQAPNLFPYIGRMTGKKYILGGREYSMDIHGFVKDSRMEAAQAGRDFVRLFLEDNPETRAQYPYRFRYEVAYRLQDNRILVEYRVENHDEKTMYFGIGGHPGFCVPLEEGLRFEDYCLQFPEGTHMKRVNFTPACFVAGGAEDFPLEEGNILRLRHDLFDQDAIILCDIPQEAMLKPAKEKAAGTEDRSAKGKAAGTEDRSVKEKAAGMEDRSAKGETVGMEGRGAKDAGAKAGSRGVRVIFPQMKYLGLWHAPETDAPYVCIEPWSSLPSRQDVVEDLAVQPGLVSLAAGRTYENRWEIQIF